MVFKMPKSPKSSDLQSIGECLVQDIMIHVGGYHEFIGSVQFIRVFNIN